jgi:HK97 family phage major capsid protein
MTSSAGLRMLRKVKDTAGAPIVTDGQPTLVLGYRAIINNDMPVPGPSAKSIAFGHFGAGYIVRAARGRQTILRLDERYGESLQVGFIGHGSYDGAPDDPAAIRVYQNSST